MNSRNNLVAILWVLLGLGMASVSCGGGGGGGGATYAVGGTVSGLSGTVVLQNNGVDDLTITADGTFTFATKVANGGAYSVTVLTQPSTRTCTASSNTGTINGADVTDVSVACSVNTYSVGGTVSGLGSGKTVVLQNNGGDDLTITSNGSFNFAAEVADGAGYSVTVKTPPAGQSCFVTNGMGANNGAAVTNVAVACYASGSLDASFGTAGLVSTPVGSQGFAFAVAIQSDGKIVAAGESSSNGPSSFSIARYKTDGTLDTAFGPGGLVSTPVGTYGSRARSIAVQTDQKLIAAGETWDGTTNKYNFALVRYSADGVLDDTFGAGGLVSTPVATADARSYAIALQSDGKIISAGNGNIGSGYDAILVRYMPNGAIDTTFGTGGTVILDIGMYDEIQSLALQPDDKILAAGYAGDDFLVVRLMPDGSPDVTFGTNGIVLTDFSGASQDNAGSILLQPDGKIVVSGITYNSASGFFDFALARYTKSGSLDTTFGANGMVTSPKLCGNDWIDNAALQADGKIVIAGPGSVTGSSPYDMVIARFESNGAPDTGFGTNGKVTVSIESQDIAYDVAVQSDGMIVVAGSSDTGSRTNFGLMRLYP